MPTRQIRSFGSHFKVRVAGTDNDYQPFSGFEMKIPRTNEICWYAWWRHIVHLNLYWWVSFQELLLLVVVAAKKLGILWVEGLLCIWTRLQYDSAKDTILDEVFVAGTKKVYTDLRFQIAFILNLKGEKGAIYVLFIRVLKYCWRKNIEASGSKLPIAMMRMKEANCPSDILDEEKAEKKRMTWLRVVVWRPPGPRVEMQNPVVKHPED